MAMLEAQIEVRSEAADHSIGVKMRAGLKLEEARALGKEGSEAQL